MVTQFTESQKKLLGEKKKPYRSTNTVQAAV